MINNINSRNLFLSVYVSAELQTFFCSVLLLPEKMVESRKTMWSDDIRSSCMRKAGNKAQWRVISAHPIQN